MKHFWWHQLKVNDLDCDHDLFVPPKASVFHKTNLFSYKFWGQSWFSMVPVFVNEDAPLSALTWYQTSCSINRKSWRLSGSSARGPDRESKRENKHKYRVLIRYFKSLPKRMLNRTKTFIKFVGRDFRVLKGLIPCTWVRQATLAKKTQTSLGTLSTQNLLSVKFCQIPSICCKGNEGHDPIRGQGSHLCWQISPKRKPLSTCFLSSFVKFCSAVEEKSKISKPIWRQDGYLCLRIG